MILTHQACPIAAPSKDSIYLANTVLKVVARIKMPHRMSGEFHDSESIMPNSYIYYSILRLHNSFYGMNIHTFFYYMFRPDGAIFRYD
jgi:hypothetical protein